MSDEEIDKNKIVTKNRHLNKLNDIFPQSATGYKFSYLNSKKRLDNTDPTTIGRGDIINDTVNASGNNIISTLSLIDDDIYDQNSKEENLLLKNKYAEIKNTSNNYFELAGVPCYKTVPFTNMVIPMPVPRYNYIITNPKTDTHMQNIISNTQLNKRKTYYFYENEYQLYNEPIYFSNNGTTVTKIGKFKKNETDIKFDETKCWRRPDFNGSSFALKNTTTHKWEVSVKRDLFTVHDVRDGKTFSILFWQSKSGKKKILCNLNKVIFPLQGQGTNTLRENEKNVQNKKRVRYFNYTDSIEGYAQAREVYDKLRITNIDETNRTITFENNDTFKMPNPRTYSEWRDKPMTITLRCVDFTRPLFNKCTTGNPEDDNWEDVKGHVEEILTVNDDGTINIGNHKSDLNKDINWGLQPPTGGSYEIKKADCSHRGIIELDGGYWFYNPSRVDLQISFDNIRTDKKYNYQTNDNINNLFDKRQMSCKFINLPTKNGCTRRPILSADYWNIKNNYPELDAKCPWTKPLVLNEKDRKLMDGENPEGFNNNINLKKCLTKNNIANAYLAASGLLFLYLLFKLKQKTKF